jgi:putative transcriptional regulator
MAEKEKINKLKLVLVEKEITQKDFAKKLAVSPNTIYRMCKNESQPSLRLLKKMANILDVDISELLLLQRKNSQR